MVEMTRAGAWPGTAPCRGCGLAVCTGVGKDAWSAQEGCIDRTAVCCLSCCGFAKSASRGMYFA
eukprot:263544-Chlamydomonas_euryale.AAC.2